MPLMPAEPNALHFSVTAADNCKKKIKSGIFPDFIRLLRISLWLHAEQERGIIILSAFLLEAGK